MKFYQGTTEHRVHIRVDSNEFRQSPYPTPREARTIAAKQGWTDERPAHKILEVIEYFHNRTERRENDNSGKK